MYYKEFWWGRIYWKAETKMNEKAWEHKIKM